MGIVIGARSPSAECVPCRRLAAGHLRSGARDLGEKQAWAADPSGSPVVAHPGTTGVNLFHAAGNSHEHQSPFLLELIGVIEAPLVGKNPVLHRHEKDDRELEPFGGMERHQRHPVGGRVPDVGVCHQSRRVEEGAERRFVFLASLRVGRVRGIGLPGRRDQFLDVRQTVIPLFVLVVGQHGAVASLLEHCFEERRYRRFARCDPGERGLECGKSTDRRRCPC